MNKKTISMTALIITILILSFSIKPRIKADNHYYEQKISETLNEQITINELVKISAEKDESTFIYLDTNQRTITLFVFVEKNLQYDASFKYDEWDTDEYDGNKFEWRYHELTDGTSFIWAISPTDGDVEVKGKSYEQEHVQLEKGLHVFFIKNKTTIDFPLEVELK
jgi:hypothetical protein